METLLLDIETAIKIRLGRVLETRSQRHNRRGQILEAEDVCFQGESDDSCAFTQFLTLQKKSTD